jgi:broad-specificity NMP kinase
MVKVISSMYEHGYSVKNIKENLQNQHPQVIEWVNNNVLNYDTTTLPPQEMVENLLMSMEGRLLEQIESRLAVYNQQVIDRLDKPKWWQFWRKK